MPTTEQWREYSRHECTRALERQEQENLHKSSIEHATAEYPTDAELTKMAHELRGRINGVNGLFNSIRERGGIDA